MRYCFEPEKIISGGQTGADRAALDVAIELGISHGGWCPKGRRAEDGPIDRSYQLVETPSREYAQRTKWNIRDSDCTLIASMSSSLSGGSQLTYQSAMNMNRPVYWLRLSQDPPMIEDLMIFLYRLKPKVINVAGPRASKEPKVYEKLREILTVILTYGVDLSRSKIL
ncbi:MAG: putative molybdenum carrier protein [Bdellovibrionales bacterium]|nr:putative molybdenum carrier protein [Bdellovibrionales bacterium]